MLFCLSLTILVGALLFGLSLALLLGLPLTVLVGALLFCLSLTILVGALLLCCLAAGILLPALFLLALLLRLSSLFRLMLAVLVGALLVRLALLVSLLSLRLLTTILGRRNWPADHLGLRIATQYAPVRDRRWRSRGLRFGRDRAAEIAFAPWPHIRQVRCGRSIGDACVDARSGHPARAGEIRLRDRGGVLAVRQAPAWCSGSRASAIQSPQVGIGGAVRREERLARAQRHPGDGSSAATRIPGHECHERGSVDRMRAARAGDPHPSVGSPRPASEVERREAPRRIVDPRPTPHPDVCPTAIPVGRPIVIHAARRPHSAVVLLHRPVAVLRQVFDARHFGSDIRVRCRGGIFRQPIPADAPLLPGIQSLGLDFLGNHLAGGSETESQGAAGTHGEPTDSASDFGLPRTRRNQGGCAILSDIEAIVSHLPDRDGSRGSVHFVDFVLVQPWDAQVDRTLRETHLRQVVVELENAEGGPLGHVDGGGANMQFGARLGVGPQAVAIGKRIIQGRGGPVLQVARPERDRAI